MIFIMCFSYHDTCVRLRSRLLGWVGLSLGTDKFRPPAESTPLNQLPKTAIRWLCRIFVLNLVQIGREGQTGENITQCYTLFLRIHLQVRPLDGFSRLIAETTWTHKMMCLLVDWLILLPISGVKSPNSQFLGSKYSFSHQTRKKNQT